MSVFRIIIYEIKYLNIYGIYGQPIYAVNPNDFQWDQMKLKCCTNFVLSIHVIFTYFLYVYWNFIETLLAKLQQMDWMTVE